MTDEGAAREPEEDDGVVVVVPCFNEAGRLPVEAFVGFADAHPGYRFLLVDDGSQDDTGRVLAGMAQDRPDRFSVLALEENQGKAEAVRRGLLQALNGAPRVVGFWDADLATPLELLPDLVGVLESRPEVAIVMGARVKLSGWNVHRSPARHYVGRVFATVVSLILRLPAYDTQCGAKVFRAGAELRTVLGAPFLTRWIFDVELLARFAAERGGLGTPGVERAVYEHPLSTWVDVDGSRLRARDFVRAPLDIARIWWAYGRT